MSKLLGLVVSTAVIGSAACGGSATSPSQNYESIADSYSGSITGLSRGVSMNGGVSVTITQNGGVMAGSWAINARLNDGVDATNILSSGTLTGTIAAGDNSPSVSLVIKASGCPSYHAVFYGSHDSANRRITVTGPIEFFTAGTCNVALTYPTALVLTH